MDKLSHAAHIPTNGETKQSRFGRSLCILGGILGFITIVIFGVSQVFAFSKSITQMPQSMFLAVFGGEIVSLLMLGTAFGAIALIATRQLLKSKRANILVIFLIALVLLIISFLTLLTIGIFIMPIAIVILVGSTLSFFG